MSDRQNGLNEIELKQVQKIQLDLLRKFAEICEENDISYYAVYGTLLGTERHKGFIPWDDDIDVAIWRKDVEKLKQIAKTSLAEPYYFVFSDEKWDFHCNVIRFQNINSTNMNLLFFQPEGKYGIGIDVEVIDYTFSNRLFRKMKHALLQFIYQLIYMKQYGEIFPLLQCMNSGKRKLLKTLTSHMKKEALVKWMERVVKSHGISKKCCSIYTYLQHHDLRVKWFEKTKKLQFEDMMISVPFYHTECLKSIYGEDYNVLPSEDERVPRHLSGRYVNPYVPVNDVIRGMRECMNVPPEKTFIIWGAGNMFEHFMKHFGEQHKPDFVVDNDDRKWGTERFGCPVCSPNRIKEYKPDQVHLVICNIYASEIAVQIGRMGNYQHYIYWENYVDQYMLRG